MAPVQLGARWGLPWRQHDKDMTPELAFHEPGARCSKSILHRSCSKDSCVCSHHSTLRKKRKEELWEQYFSQILDCYAFYFHEQSHEDIVMQIKKCKIWLWFDLKKIWDMDNNKIFLKLRNKSSSGNSQGGEKAFIKIHSSLSCSPEPPMH